MRPVCWQCNVFNIHPLYIVYKCTLVSTEQRDNCTFVYRRFSASVNVCNLSAFASHFNQPSLWHGCTMHIYYTLIRTYLYLMIQVQKKRYRIYNIYFCVFAQLWVARREVENKLGLQLSRDHSTVNRYRFSIWLSFSPSFFFLSFASNIFNNTRNWDIGHILH